MALSYSVDDLSKGAARASARLSAFTDGDSDEDVLAL